MQPRTQHWPTNTAEETMLLFFALLFNNKNLLPLLEEADVDWIA